MILEGTTILRKRSFNLKKDFVKKDSDLVQWCLSVFPFHRVGLIEWMQHTKPLKEFVKDALKDEEMENYNKASKYQQDWLHKHADNYKVMYR